MNIEVLDEIDTDYIKEIKKLGFKYSLFINPSDPRDLGALRLKFFDLGSVEKMSSFSLDDFQKNARVYLNDETFNTNIEKLNFETNKVIYSNNKLYPSKIHYKKDVSFNLGERSNVIDDPLFWEDFEHFYFSYEK
jgi:hypothetical protein